MKRKKELIVILSSLLVIVLSVSVAYFTTKILGEGKEISVESADLKVIFTSGSGTINGTNIEPGWTSGENTFTVKNESNGTYKYNIIIKDLVNTFVTEGFLQYKITSTDGGYNMSEFKDVPKSAAAKDEILAYSVEIAKGKTHSYSVEFKYTNSANDQSDDMGKELSGTLYIEKGTLPKLSEKLLADNPTIKTRTDFNTTFTETNTGTLYKATESIAGSTAKDVYYFAGDAKNNWVKFGNFYWRIIRTNSDESIRLLYSGKSPNTTTGYIGISVFNENYDDSMYVGYKYGTSGTQASNRTNENNSTIKTYIDNWYSTNLSSYSKYISTEAVYCNDREVGSGTYSATGSIFYYAAYIRLYSNNAPSYNCTNIKDAFSGSNNEAKLTYPIGLMTADEIVYAGGNSDTSLPSPFAWYYLNSTGDSITGSAYWWSLSPMKWGGGSSVWHIYGSYSPGYPSSSLVSNGFGVRPAISIKSDALWSSGDGSPENPYEIVYN